MKEVIANFYEEEKRLRVIEISKWLYYVHLLVDRASVFSYTINNVTYRELFDEEYDDYSYFNVQEYSLLTKEGFLPLGISLSSYDMWVPWEGYIKEASMMEVPLIHKEGTLSDGWASFELLEKYLDTSKSFKVHPLVINYLHELEKTQKDNPLSEEDYESALASCYNQNTSSKVYRLGYKRAR